MNVPESAGSHAAAESFGRTARRQAAGPVPLLARIGGWCRAAAGRAAEALVAPATRRETLLWGVLLLALLMMVMQWNRRTVIVVPVSENPRVVIT